jgi:hypothetical protein
MKTPFVYIVFNDTKTLGKENQHNNNHHLELWV